MAQSSKQSPHPQWATAHRKPGTELKKIKDKYYLYAVKSVYDKSAKKARKISLGIIGSITQKDGLIPSDKARLKEQVNSAGVSITKVWDKEYGFSFFMKQEIQKDILPALKQHFADHWKIIIALAYCRIVYQAPLKNIPFHLGCAALLQMLDLDCPTEKTVSETLRKVGSLRNNAVAYMRHFSEPNDCVLVDATDISCNSNNISLSQKGYNSDMTFEPQVTLLYIYSAKTHRPFFFRLVAGNIKDVSALKNALIESGITEAIFISDKGFYSEANIIQLTKLKMKYIIPLRRDNKAIKYQLLSDIETKTSYFKFRNRYIFYDSYSHDNKQICLFQDGKLKEEEKTDYLNRISSLPEKYSQQGYQEKIKSMGTIAMMHNTDLKKPEDVYEHYKSRAEIEQFFDCYKNTIDAYASYMQNEDALQGWMFINHVAMQSYLWFI